MFKMMVSPKKYIQGPGLLENAGPYVLELGDKPFLIGDEVVLSIVRDPLERYFMKEGIEIKVAQFMGECSRQEIDRLKEIAREQLANVIIGAGGGKAIDTAKVIGYHLRYPAVIIPTIASTDAPTSSIAVIYREDHCHESYILLRKNPDLILVDTQIIAHSPCRFLVSGMGDALSTKFEAEACFRSFGKNIIGGRPTLAALNLARLTYNVLTEYGLRSKWSVERKIVTPSLENIVEANILLSGLGFESGGLAAAHAVQVGLAISCQASRSYHGEKVAFGTLVQLMMEDRPKEEIEEVGKFSLSVGLPVTLEDLFVEEREISEIAEEACRQNIMKNMPIPVSQELVINSILAADSFGRYLKEKTKNQR